MNTIRPQKSGFAAFKEAAVEGLVSVNEALRYVNLYRAAEYQASKRSLLGRRHIYKIGLFVNCMGHFYRHDQDRYRESLQRKLDLSYVSTFESYNIVPSLELACRSEIKNLAVLHHLRRAHDVVMGERSSHEDSLAYMRRAWLKIHPDKSQDLNGWEYPGAEYWMKPPGYKAEHAKMGAKELLRIHTSFRRLLLLPYYQKALWQHPVAAGPKLTVSDLACDLTLFSIAGCVALLALRKSLRPFALVSGCMYAVIAGVQLFNVLREYRNLQTQEKCRDLVLYKKPETQND